MDTEIKVDAYFEKMGSTNIVGETKKMIMDELSAGKSTRSGYVSDDEVKKAVERINPDPNSLKSRG